MVIISHDKCSIPATVMADLLKRIFNGADTHIYESSPLDPLGHDGYSISISPVGESSFSVNVGADEQGYSLDGLDDQNARAAVAIRDLLNDTGPVIAIDVESATYVDLVLGMDPEHFYEGWQSWDSINRDIWS